MPIDPEFPKNHQVIGKRKHADGGHFHFVWGPGRAAEAAENEEVRVDLHVSNNLSLERSSSYS